MKNCVKRSCWFWVSPQHQGILTVESRDWLRMFGCFPSLQWLLEHVGTSFLAYFNVAPRHEAVLLTICQGNGERGCCTELWESLVLGKEQPFITGKWWKVFFDTHKICAWCMLQIACPKARFKEKKSCIWLNYLLHGFNNYKQNPNLGFLHNSR